MTRITRKDQMQRFIFCLELGECPCCDSMNITCFAEEFGGSLRTGEGVCDGCGARWWVFARAWRVDVQQRSDYRLEEIVVDNDGEHEWWERMLGTEMGDDDA